MSASALRYKSCPGRNHNLRERIVALAHRHRRYGAPIIYLEKHHACEVVNHKRETAEGRVIKSLAVVVAPP